MLDQLRDSGFAQGLKYASVTGYAEMQTCVQSSLTLLKPSDRLSLAQLSLFPSKFDVAAAASVLGMSQKEAQLQLNQLQRLSLVIKDEAQGEPRSELQYQLHLFIRDMALTGYEADPKYLEAQSRFLQHFAEILKATEHRHTPAGIASLHQLAQERHNLVKMFATLAEQQQQPASTNMSACCNLGQAGLDAIWLLRLDLEVVCAAMETLLKWATACSHTNSVIDAQEQLGYMLTYDSRQMDRAGELLGGALEARKQGKHARVQLVLSLVGLANVVSDKINASDIDESEGCLQGRLYWEEAHSILQDARGQSDPVTLWAALHACNFIQNDSEQIQAITKVLASAQRELPDHHPAVLNIKSELAATSRSIPLLVEHLDQCMSQVGHNERLIPEAMLMLGNALAHSKQPSQQQEGLQYISRGLKLAEVVYSTEDVIAARQETLGRALIAVNQVDEAIRVLEDSLPICEKEHGDDSRITWVGFTILADAYEAKGDYTAAARVFARAHSKIKQSAKRNCGKQSEEVFAVKSGIWCQMAINLELLGRYMSTMCFLPYWTGCHKIKIVSSVCCILLNNSTDTSNS